MRKLPRFEIPDLQDDGLLTPTVKDWADDKYRLVSLYTRLFTKSMAGKWGTLVYLDLYAGAGRSKLENSKRILPASPTLALSSEPPFDLYVFCEQDAANMGALKERVHRDFSDREVRFAEGDVNEMASTLLEQIPAGSKHHRVLGFCFVDPFSLQNLRFSTIEALAQRHMDFLVLIPTGFDATRNEQLLVEPDVSTLDHFLGTTEWRDDWETAKAQRTTFDEFITDAFGASMQRLGYRYGGVHETQLIRMTTKNVPLYRLALYSRHPLGEKFWREVKKYAPDQRSLPF